MKKRILGFILSLAMVATVAINPTISYATTEEIGAPTQMEIDEFRKDKEIVTDMKGNEYSWYSKTPDAPEGYVFGGWYTAADCTTPIGDEVVSGEAWAKWVPESVLSVRYQLTAGTTTETAETALRVITTVDSTDYQKVGFVFTYEGKTSKTALSNTVYKTIIGQVNGTEKTYKPTETFGENSKYFMVVEMAQLPQSAFAEDLVVDPIWVTLDGTKVVGVRNTINVSEVATVNDFSEGITFEKNRTEINRFTKRTETHASYCKPEVVSYQGNIEADTSQYGEKGLKVYKKSGNVIRFYMDFGREIPKGSKLTFDIYIQGEVAVDETDTSVKKPGVSYKQMLVGGNNSHSAQFGGRLKSVNAWTQVTYTLNQLDKSDFCLVIINLESYFGDNEVNVYMDNFEIQTPYSAGVDFEMKSQTAFLTEAGTSVDTRSNPSRVLYSTTGVSVDEKEYGLYGIQCQIEKTGWYPAFYLNWGEGVIDAGDKVTFSVYVKGPETLQYKVESSSRDAKGNKIADDSVTKSTGDGWPPVNDWFEVTLTINGKAPVKERVFFNFANEACKEAVATGEIQFYVDNFKVIKAN